MNKQVLLFDLDGTLTDSAPGIIHSAMYALKAFGIDANPEDLRKFIGPPLSESFMEFYGFSSEKAELAVKKYREYFSDRGIFENKPYPQIEKTLISLKTAGKRLLVATSKPEPFAKRILDHFSLSTYFEGITGSELDGTRGSKAEVIACALERAGVSDKQTAVMIGDRKHDILGAQKNNLSSIGVLYGYGSREELEQAGATRIVSSHAELLEILR